MLIEEITIAASRAAEFGLKELKFQKLGQIVLLAGRNGAGKSRVLNILSNEAERLRNLQEMRPNFINDIKENEAIIAREQEAVTQAELKLQTEEQQHEIEYLNGIIAGARQTLRHYANRIQEQQEALELTKNLKMTGTGKFFHFVPKDLHLKDPNALARKVVFRYAEAVKTGGISQLAEGALSAIQVAQNRYYSTSHRKSQATKEEKRFIKADYKRLVHMIDQFLGAKLQRNSDEDATLFGFPIGKARLSDGQKILLQFCVALYAQEISLPDVIFLLDEPENHLHPAALNYVLDRLQQVVTRGQIWIATHSINVLAHFKDATIYYLEDGAAKYAGNIPEKVLEGLLGDEQEREKLANFLALPFEMSNNLFAYESLLVPDVVMTGGDDPQLRQIQEALRQVCDNQGKVRILDYGAGRGRLIATIQEMEAPKSAEAPVVWLDYIAYDSFATHADECRSNIERVYGKATNRYFTQLQALRENHREGTFDIVLLTNVFHEIDPKEWLKTLKEIKDLLKPEGFLLLVEDQRLPHGERAHEYGFLVLNKLEFQQLFGITQQQEEDGLYVCREAQDGRLRAHYFKRKLLEQVNNETRLAALKELQKNAEEAIRDARKNPDHSFKAGKLHAFWLNQFANAVLAMA